MTTVIATHPLGFATVTAHPWDYAVAASEVEGYALDARVTALAAVVTPGPAVKAELVAVAKAIDAAEIRESVGGRYADQAQAWRTRQIGVLRGHATRLGYDPETLDIR